MSTTQLAARVTASPGQGAVRLSIVAMGLGYAITGADPTILSTNLVKVEHGLQLSSNTGSFMASLATLSLAATILGAGTLGDLYGKKRLFVYGLVGTIVFDLLEHEGLCLGGSSGINVAGAIRLAQELGPGHTIVTILADYGTRYQSKLFDPAFLRSKKLPVPEWLERSSKIAIPFEKT